MSTNPASVITPDILQEKVEAIKAILPASVKDTKLNLASVLSSEGAPDLSEEQRLAIALASAYATKQPALITAMRSLVEALPEHEKLIEAAQSVTAIMAMNNVYYRFVHVANQAAINQLPVKLRMQGLANPAIGKETIELIALAVSAIHFCERCITSHVDALLQTGCTPLAIQSCIRIAAVVNAAGTSMGMNG